MDDQQHESVLDKKRKMILAVDFDGTIVEDQWPDIGDLKPNCKEILNALHDIYNCEILIWTCRDTEYGGSAKVAEFLTKQGVKFDCINTNTDYIKNAFKVNKDSRKVYADLYIDDKSLHFAISDRGIVWTDILQAVLKHKERKQDNFL